MKKLAVIGSGRMAWIICRNAHEMDIETFCFSNVKSDFILSETDNFYDISIFDKEKIAEICRKNGIDGVIATTEKTISIASYLAQELGLPGLPYETALEITDKFRNRKLSSDVEELASLKYLEVSGDDTPDLSDFPFPIIIKPISRGGKCGITVVDEPGKLERALKYARDNSNGQSVIIEEYISEGKEYSVETLSCNGKHYIIQITEKISSGPPHCVELGHHQPARLSEEMLKKIEKALTQGLTAIGVDNTASHTEIKITGEKIYIIEYNIRPGGDHIAWPLTLLSTGYNYIKGAIEIALGTFKGVDTSRFEHNYSGVYFVTKQTERLKPVFDECERYPWLYEVNRVSDNLSELEHNDCYGTNSIIYYSKEERIDL